MHLSLHFALTRALANHCQSSESTRAPFASMIEQTLAQTGWALPISIATPNDGELVLGAPLVGIRGGRSGTTPTGLTGAITAPANATTPVGWLEIRINGTLFKTPLYQ